MLMRSNRLQGRRQEEGEGREADEERMMNELSMEVNLATKGFERILKQKLDLNTKQMASREEAGGGRGK